MTVEKAGVKKTDSANSVCFLTTEIEDVTMPDTLAAAAGRDSERPSFTSLRAFFAVYADVVKNGEAELVSPQEYEKYDLELLATCERIRQGSLSYLVRR